MCSGGDGGRLPVLPGLSDGPPVAGTESERRPRRRPHLSVLHVPTVLLLHGLAQGKVAILDGSLCSAESSHVEAGHL